MRITIILTTNSAVAIHFGVGGATHGGKKKHWQEDIPNVVPVVSVIVIVIEIVRKEREGYEVKRHDSRSLFVGFVTKAFFSRRVRAE